jgi:hypothetical protein
MSNLTTISDADLAVVTGGATEDPMAPIGSPERCAFLASDIQNRKNLIAKDAVSGTIGGDRSQLTPRMYANGAILSREQFEYQRRCRPHEIG